MKIEDHNQRVGGLWCTEVLQLLSDYLDGDLPPENKAQVEVHLANCANCARFGADVGALLQSLPAQRSEMTADVLTRLRAALTAVR